MVKTGLVLAAVTIFVSGMTSIGEATSPREYQQTRDGVEATGQGESTEKEPRKTKDIEETARRADACNCCRNCRAATHTVRGKEEGPPPGDGCKDCCDKCGASDMIPPETIPPERISR